MFKKIDASGYREAFNIYEDEFQRVLCKICLCYQLMKQAKVTLDNDENKIRDVLVIGYLKNNSVLNKIGLIGYAFDREVPEDTTPGRTDIKVISQNYLKNQEAYYIIECKRINNINVSGTTGLNGEYIKNGICRFTSNHYKSYHRVNGMIGFVVDEMNIHSNTQWINELLNTHFEDANTQEGLTKDSFIPDFEYHYKSKHLDNKNRQLILYHVMFDFAEKMKTASSSI